MGGGTQQNPVPTPCLCPPSLVKKNASPSWVGWWLFPFPVVDAPSPTQQYCIHEQRLLGTAQGSLPALHSDCVAFGEGNKGQTTRSQPVIGPYIHTSGGTCAVGVESAPAEHQKRCVEDDTYVSGKRPFSVETKGKIFQQFMYHRPMNHNQYRTGCRFELKCLLLQKRRRTHNNVAKQIGSFSATAHAHAWSAALARGACGHHNPDAKITKNSMTFSTCSMRPDGAPLRQAAKPRPKGCGPLPFVAKGASEPAFWVGWITWKKVRAHNLDF